MLLTPELISRYDSDLAHYNGQPFEGMVSNTPSQSSKVIDEHYDALRKPELQKSPR